MKATLNAYGIPRILVRLARSERESKMSHLFKMPDGSNGSIITKLPMYEEVDKWELNVSVGTVVALSDKADGIEIGDIAIIDYTVDCDEQYVVGYVDGDKIVSVPCQTRLHDKDIIVTTYYSKIQNPKTKVVSYVPHGEKNIKVAAKGDVDQLSLVLGIVRNNQVIPNESYLFCKVPVVSTAMVEKNGILSYAPVEEKVLQREVIFAHPKSGFKAGDQIIAVRDSAFKLELYDYHFDMIGVHDVMAMVEIS